MSAPLKPLGDRIVAIKEEAPAKTASGLYLTEKAREKTVSALVEAIGPDVKAIKVGDRIIYRGYDDYSDPAKEVKVKDVNYLILKEEDVLATLSDKK